MKHLVTALTLIFAFSLGCTRKPQGVECYQFGYPKGKAHFWRMPGSDCLPVQAAERAFSATEVLSSGGLPKFLSIQHTRDIANGALYGTWMPARNGIIIADWVYKEDEWIRTDLASTLRHELFHYRLMDELGDPDFDHVDPRWPLVN